MSESETKPCKTCKRVLPLDQFHRDKNRPDGRCYECRDCRNQYLRDHFDLQSSKDKRKNWDLKKLYGITLEEYQHMVEDQEGCCAICGEEPDSKQFHVDHDHETGKVRGLLCFKCNSLLGMANESIEILMQAIQYLELFGG